MFAYPPFVVSIERRVSLSAQPDIQYIIAEHLQKLTLVASDLSRSSTVHRYLRSAGNDELLSALAADETQVQKVGNIIFADAYGFTRGQSILTLRRGDHLPRVTRWGSALARQGSVAMVSTCPVAPLLLVSGASVWSETKVVGGVYAVDYLDDAFARRIRDEQLSTGAEVAFVSRADGIVGSSLNSAESRQLMSALVQDVLVQNRTDSYPSHVRVGDTYYFLEMTPLLEEDATIGYVLVLVPSLDDSVALFFACLIALAFFTIHVGVHELKHRTLGYSHSHGVVIAAVAIAVFIIAFLSISAVLKSSATDLKKPGFAIYNSTMHLVPESGTVRLGTELRVGIEIQTGGEAINVASARVEFDPVRVHIAELNMEHSFCDPYFIIRREIDNDAGVVTVSCGVTGKQGASALGTQLELGELVVVPRVEGPFGLHIAEDTHVLASDGLGTEVLRSTTDGFYRAYKGSAAEHEVLEVVSLSHPNSARWYRERTVSMLFLPATVGVQYTLSRNPSASTTMSETKSHATGTTELLIPEDGIYYVAARKPGTQAIRSVPFVLHVDSTPPDAPLVRARTLNPSRGEIVQFRFESSDAMSGLQSIFYVSMDGGMYWPVGSDFLVPFMTSGTHTVSVRAYDQAGNHAETQVTVQVR